MVLSKHESDDGEQAYKRVVKTFRLADKKKIVHIKFYDKHNHGEMCLFATEDHPFWVDEMGGWTPLKDLPRFEEVVGLTLRDIHHQGITVRNTPWIPLRKTDVEDIALCSEVDQWEASCGASMLVDFSNSDITLVGSQNGLIAEYSNYYNWSPAENIKRLPPCDENDEVRLYSKAILSSLEPVEEYLDNAYTAHVYNIEVEDFHTYYVGRAGVFTHS